MLCCTLVFNGPGCQDNYLPFLSYSPGWTWYWLASSAEVLSSLYASRATFALNAGGCFVLILLLLIYKPPKFRLGCNLAYCLKFRYHYRLQKNCTLVSYENTSKFHTTASHTLIQFKIQD